MSVFTTVDVQHLRPWLRARGIANLHHCTGIQGGTVNTNYWLETDQGPWVLTLVEDRPAAAVRPIMDLMHALAQAGLPVPDVRGDDSDDLVGELHERPATLVAACPGHHPPATPALGGQVGHFLARLHGEALPDLMPLPNRFGGTWQQARIQHWQERLPAHKPLLVEAGELSAHLWAQDWPVAWTHGDLFPDNVLVENDRITAVIDWYFASVTPAIWDLAVALNAWFGSESLREEGPAALLRAYETVRPLTDAEHRALPLWRQNAALRFWLSRLDAAAEAQGDQDRITVKPADEYRQLLLDLLHG